VAPLSVKLATMRATGLPTGSVATVEEAAAATGGRCVLARPAEPIVRKPPRPGSADRVFAEQLVETAPRTVVAELPGGRLLGPHHAVIDGNGDLVYELSYYFGTTRPREHPLFLHPFPPAPLHVQGRLGVLATRGDANYYHFLMDVLPRLATLAACPEIEPPERWYVPAATRFQRELLDRVGITEERRIDSSVVPHVRAETLIVPTPPAMTVVNPPWVVSHLRATLLDPPIERVDDRAIYVTRGGSANNRAVRNEDAVMAALAARGFEFVDPGAMSVAEQIRCFAEATVIVAPHGAALANLVFASAGATVVELFPAGSVVPDYWKLSGGVPGLDYRYLTGVGRRQSGTRSQMLVSDIEVDLPALESVLDDVSSPRTENPSTPPSATGR
jgi:capsular polysaccharide biosynthesis protein